MEEVNVGRSDLLWKWYCKRYEVMGEPVPSPKNFCRYFWIALFGFALYFRHEIQLRYLWLVVLASSVVIAITTRYEHPVSVVVGFTAIVTAMVLGNIVVAIAGFRAFDFVERKVPWLLPLIGLCLMVSVVSYEVWQGTFWQHMAEFMCDTFRIVGYFFGIVCVLSILGFVVVSVVSLVPSRHTRNLEKLRQDISAFVATRNKRICPPVNPPTGFKEH